MHAHGPHEAEATQYSRKVTIQISSYLASDGYVVPYHLRMATERYSPSTLTSIEAITITQTLRRPGNPPTGSTFTLTTTLTLSKPPPTGVGGSNSQAHSARLPPSAIGAIVGSILGFILLLVLILYCCRAPSEDTYSDSEGSPEPDRYKRPPVPDAGRSYQDVADEVKIERTADGTYLQQIRPSRRRRRPPMNEVHKEPKDPILPPETILWLAGRRA